MYLRGLKTRVNNKLIGVSRIKYRQIRVKNTRDFSKLKIRFLIDFYLAEYRV